MQAHQKERFAGKLLLDARAEIERLQGIIARNAMQRLDERDNANLYVTVDDIKASLEVLDEWQKRQAPNAEANGRAVAAEQPLVGASGSPNPGGEKS